MNWPKNVLMSDPSFFDVEYAINTHMIDVDGNLNKIDKDKALSQWNKLKDTFTQLGLNVHLIAPVEGLPDMVFTANQTLPFLRDDKTHFILSHMHHPQRQDEVKHFKGWIEENGFTSIDLVNPMSFEGMGDALWNYETGEIFGGFGFRTKEEMYDEVENHIGVKIHKLTLTNVNFYHLDTCLAIANKDTAFYVPSGFDQESQDLLKNKFKNLVEIPEEEAIGGFAANLCAVNGTDIIIQENNPITCEAAEHLGLKVHTLDTSEFMKSGGSVFCMKQLFW
jgi:N-dimethylarginine dimethylaminohydrolase